VAASVGGVVTVAKHYQRCVHFCGIQKVCNAGVAPKSVRDESQSGPYRWPCLSLIGREEATTTCALRRIMTAAELAAEEAEIVAACDKFEADLKADRCPHCQTPIQAREVRGRCEYALPCSHRIGQVAQPEYGL
jgi:hypothetical protein